MLSTFSDICRHCRQLVSLLSFSDVKAWRQPMKKNRSSISYWVQNDASKTAMQSAKKLLSLHKHKLGTGSWKYEAKSKSTIWAALQKEQNLLTNNLHLVSSGNCNRGPSICIYCKLGDMKKRKAFTPSYKLTSGCIRGMIQICPAAAKITNTGPQNIITTEIYLHKYWEIIHTYNLSHPKWNWQMTW